MSEQGRVGPNRFSTQLGAIAVGALVIALHAPDWLGFQIPGGQNDTISAENVHADQGGSRGNLIGRTALGAVPAIEMPAIEQLELQLQQQQQEIASLRTMLATLSADQQGQPESSVLLRRLTESEQRAVVADNLVDSGFTSIEADELLDAVDALTFQQLQLRYAALTNDGQVDEATRAQVPDRRTLIEEQFGDGAYDRYLYAAGRSNRVVVNKILPNSPAADFGLQPGDSVLSVDGRPIYSNRDLIRAITQASSEQMSITLQRGGQRISRVVPKGPLGVTISNESVDPNSAGRS